MHESDIRPIYNTSRDGEIWARLKLKKINPANGRILPVAKFNALGLFFNIFNLCRYQRLIKEQEENFSYLVSELKSFGEERSMEILGYNGVSVALSLKRFIRDEDVGNRQLIDLGSRLFRRNISGPR